MTTTGRVRDLPKIAEKPGKSQRTQGSFLKIVENLVENVKKAFDENGISIPYPQMDVHMK